MGYNSKSKSFKKTKSFPHRIVCQICNKVFYIPKWRYRCKGIQKCKYCSIKCHRLAQTKRFKQKAIDNLSKFPRFSKEFLSYVAGIFDGEGNLTLTKRHKEDIYCVWSIANSNKNLMKFLHKYIPFTTILKYHKKLEKWKTVYKLGMYKRANICKFMKLLSPYLIVKKKDYKKLLKTFPAIFSSFH